MDEKRYEIEYREDGEVKRKRAGLNTFIGAKRQAKALKARGVKGIKIRYIDDEGELVHQWDVDKNEFTRPSRLGKNVLVAVMEWAQGKTPEQREKFALRFVKMLSSTRGDEELTVKMVREELRAFEKRNG